MGLSTHPHCHKWLQDICIVLPHPVDTNPRNQELKWMFAPLSVTCFVTGTSHWWTALILLSLLGLHDGLLWPSLLHAPTLLEAPAALTSCLHCCSQSHYLVKHCQEQLSLLFLPGIHSLTLLIPDELQLTSKRANTMDGVLICILSEILRPSIKETPVVLWVIPFSKFSELPYHFPVFLMDFLENSVCSVLCSAWIPRALFHTFMDFATDLHNYDTYFNLKTVSFNFCGA